MLTTTTHSTDRTIDLAVRTFHLVDLENLSGGPRRSPADHRRAWSAYERTAGVAAPDQVVVAASGLVMSEAVWFLPTGIRAHLANGADGADRVLLAAGDAVWIAARFDRLVIGSGDHAFVELADEVRSLGARVDVVVGRGRCSARYRTAGHTVRRLRLDDDLALAV